MLHLAESCVESIAINLTLPRILSATTYTDGMPAFCEPNEVAPLREVFIQAYERSAQRHTVIRCAV